MPSSRPNHLSYLGNQILTLRPKSILDVGIGFGSKGMMFREYTDIWYGNYTKGSWTTRIDGIEIFDKYIEKLQKEIYDRIFYGDAFEIVDKLGKYDLIYAGDIIEHFDKEKGKELLEKMKQNGKTVIIVTPIKVLNQGAVYGNEAERHLSQWTKEDFEGAEINNFGNVMVVKYG